VFNPTLKNIYFISRRSLFAVGGN